eukprot:TRINITY_DN6526_c0_g1_i1.p1 TRINITY_DN6526_c0_g1~~TRINITY_DN6526_c0_g1_i1.p1  ORF type:complete len:188 (-),score=37.40 TRINITY_DN6526_c0_g1_i1:439-1002(-)
MIGKKILIVHPKDESTSFLKPIYEKLENKTVITGGISKKRLIELIDENEIIIMMGHGMPSGLMSMNQFDTNDSFIIGHNNVEHLKKKEYNIFIWCNADEFVNEFNLKGFYSGMFISEVEEAEYCGLGIVDHKLVQESNDFFAVELGKLFSQNLSLEEISISIKQKYSKIAESNLIAKYNNDRLYFSK